MELTEKLNSLAALLSEHPKIHQQSDTRLLFAKFDKAVDELLAKLEQAIYRNTAEYAELLALVSGAQYKALVTVDWLNANAASVKKKYAKTGKKEKEDFVLTMVKAGKARAIIKELKETPRRQMQDELNDMALGTDEKAIARIKAMKAKQLEQFCEFNDIPVGKTAKGALDKKQVQAAILQKIGALREYAQLTKVQHA